MKHGENIRKEGKSIYFGTVPTFKIIKDVVRGISVVKWWVGTDALIMRLYPPGMKKRHVLLHRIKMRLLGPLISEHWVVSESLLRSLPKLSAKIVPMLYKPTVYKKIPHAGCNVLVYQPGRNDYEKWVYGWDITQDLIRRWPQLSWHIVDGKADMSKVYPRIDLYIRPTRHDGDPRMVREAVINNIPYYWSQDGDPNVKEISQWLVKKGERTWT